MSPEAMKLSEAEIVKRLQSSPHWIMSNGELQRTFVLPSFPSAIFFVNAVAHLAEAEEHHPDIRVFYNKVILNFATHSAGGITEKDFTTVRRVDELWHIFDRKA